MTGLVLAAAAAASMWFYVIDVLKARQIADSMAKEIPRGNLSDLYPRWLGARELLLHHRNPYSSDVTFEIQEGYYGRRLDSSRPNDPKDQQGFAYPVYVVFLLAPLIGFAFHNVQIFFYWLLGVLTALNTLLWLRVLRWRLPPVPIATAICLTLGTFAAVQGIKLQQLSLLVTALLAGSAACATGGFFFCSGALLAIATVKPQLTAPLAAWFLLWAVSDWKSRRRFLSGFALTMAVLLVGAEIVLPGWWRMFAQAVTQYHQYTQNQSVIEVILDQILGDAAARVAGQIVALFAIIVCGLFAWRFRGEEKSEAGFVSITALVLALTVFIAPMYAPYNQLLLIPAILLLVRDRSMLRSRILHLAGLFGALLVVWQWLATLCLAVGYRIESREWALARWRWPLFTTLLTPVWIFMLIFFYVQRRREDHSPIRS